MIKPALKQGRAFDLANGVEPADRRCSSAAERILPDLIYQADWNVSGVRKFAQRSIPTLALRTNRASDSFSITRPR
jgi:hypothetical protein